MAQKLPKVLQNFNMFVGGFGLASANTNVKLPTLTMRTKEHQGGGQFTPVEIPVGTEKLDFSFNMVEFDRNVLGLFGKAETQLTFRGFARNNLGEEQTINVYATGMVKEIAPSDNSPGNGDGTIDFMVALTHLAIELDGAEIWNIDAVNGKCIMDGEDIAGGMADALGLT